MLARLKHWLAHLFHWNYCTMDSYWKDEKLIPSIICNYCGKRRDLAD